MTPLDDATAFFVEAVEPEAVGARIVPFEPWHLPLLVQREHERESFAALGGIERTVALCDSAEYAYSVVVAGSPVACIGVSVLWAGAGAAWAFLSADARRHWKTIHSGVATFLRGALCDGEFRRIQTSVRIDHAAGHRWALRLGFTPESVLQRYCPDGADAVCYVRLAHDRR